MTEEEKEDLSSSEFSSLDEGETEHSTNICTESDESDWTFGDDFANGDDRRELPDIDQSKHIWCSHCICVG